MRQEETFDGAVKHHHLQQLVGFERRDNFIQLRNGLRTEDIEWRVIERDSPVRWRALYKMDLFCLSLGAVLVFQWLPFQSL